MNKIIFYLLLALLLKCSISINAQVTIGSGTVPLHGALLDLKEEGITKRGLGMPRVQLSDLNKLKMGANEILDTDNGGNQYNTHIGLFVYNVNKTETKTSRICPDPHVWDGKEWQALNNYTPVREQEILISLSDRNYEYLDPTNAIGWPTDKIPSNYPLGHIGTFTDNRSNEIAKHYNHARFYVGYDNKTLRGTTHGQAMKSQIMATGSSYTTNGLSNAANAGGFNAQLSGRAGASISGYGYGTFGIFWTSSSAELSYNFWLRSFVNSDARVERNKMSPSNMLSVRCKKDTK